MTLNILPNLKMIVGATKRGRQTLFQVAKYSWEPKEVETHTGQVSCLPNVLYCIFTRLTLTFLVVEMGKG